MNARASRVRIVSPEADIKAPLKQAASVTIAGRGNLNGRYLFLSNSLRDYLTGLGVEKLGIEDA